MSELAALTPYMPFILAVTVIAAITFFITLKYKNPDRNEQT